LISIVDDDPLARNGIRELVESLGYETITFESAEHFLESSMVAETTCLITDVQMPGLNGLELQETLRSQGHHTPIILITAYPNEKHRTRALDAGAVGFLSKPFDEASLIKCLAAFTASAQAVKRFSPLGCTTSIQDSGLLGHILPLFRVAGGIDVQVKKEETMAEWYFSGDYFENCNCSVVCPCLVSKAAPLTSRPTEGVCDVAFIVHVETGRYDDVALGWPQRGARNPHARADGGRKLVGSRLYRPTRRR
jgi:CheY-like chemotaxis protein